MTNLKKKIIAVITALTCVVMLAPGLAQGQTADELQAQITALLAQLTTLQAQLGTLQGTSTPATVTGCTVTSFARNLKVSMTGDDVKCLQVILNSDAATTVAATGVGSAGSETTYFGNLTKAAVVKFQEKYAADCLTPLGLTAGTGFVGTKTLAKLNTMLGAGTTTPGTTTPGTTTPGTTTTVPAGEVKVALATDTPAAATVIADTTPGDGGQALAELAKFKFEAGSAAKVTTLKLTRGGISADADLANIYLYDGVTRIAEFTSFSNKVVTFTSAAGLFSIAAGGSTTVTVKADIANGTTAGKTINFGIASSADVVVDSGTVTGTFPVTASSMSTATVGDLGKLTIANVAPAAATTVDPGQTQYEVWRFSVAAGDQKMSVSYLSITNVGSVAAADLTNYKLYNGATLLGSVDSMAADKTITFDLAASPLVINSGVTQNLSLKADIVAGSTRTYRFSVQKASDIVAYDMNYGIYVKPNQTDAFAIIQAGGATTINPGTVIVSVASDSVTGYVPKDAVNVELAKFNLKAAGEAVKILSLDVDVDLTGASNTKVMKNIKLVLDGTQVSTTKNLTDNADTTYTFGNTFIIPAGETKVLKAYGDIITTDAVNAFAAGDSITVTLEQGLGGATNAQGMTSLTAITTSVGTGRTLAVAVGTMAVRANAALGNYAVASPTGVVGGTEKKIASFVIVGGAGEGTRINQIVLEDNVAGKCMGEDYQNLMLKDAAGTQIGSTIGTLNATATATTYTFTPSTTIEVAAGAQYVVDVYADILTNATNTAGNSSTPVKVNLVSGTGLVTNTATNISPALALQAGYISGAGDFAAITVVSDDPIAQQYVMATADVTLAKFKLQANSAEAIDVSQMLVYVSDGDATDDEAAVRGDVVNFKLYDGSTLLSSVSSLTSPGTNATEDIDGVASFVITPALRVPKGMSKIVTVKADINYYPNATSGAGLVVSLDADASTELATNLGMQALKAAGVDSGLAVATLKPAADQAAAVATIYGTKLTVAHATDTPSGASTGSAGQVVAKFVVTNAANLLNLDATLKLLNLDVNSTITPSTNARTIKIYKTSVTGGNLLATATYNDGTAFVDTDSADTAITEGTFTDVTIAPNTSVTLIVTADTLYGTSTENFSVGIEAADITWSDQLTGAIAAVDSLPITGKTLTY